MKAVIVFVEGQADAWFVLRSLGQLAGASFDQRKPEELPTPFGRSPGQGSQSSRGLVRSWNERMATMRTMQASAEDNEPVFQAAAVIPPKSTEPQRPDLIFVVRMGGDRKVMEVSKLVEELGILFTSGLKHDVKQLACAFVFDADTPSHYQQMSGDCVALREQRFAADFAAVLARAQPPSHAHWTSTQPFPVGLFVLHQAPMRGSVYPISHPAAAPIPLQPPTRSGTLEHLLEPNLRADPLWGPRLQAAEELLLAHQQPQEPVSDPTGAERAKARLTIGGQWSAPGASLAQIVRRGDPKKAPTIPDHAFASPEAAALVSLLMTAPW